MYTARLKGQHRGQRRGQLRGQTNEPSQYKQRLASAVLLHEADNVICLLRKHKAGEKPKLIDPRGHCLDAPALKEDIPLGHKVAFKFITQNATVVKYGAVIGRATESIQAGTHVHRHNLIGDLQAQYSV